MKNAKLTALTIENFKSFKDPTRIELAPLTILLGRNNSGKSSIIQSLLLLKQTLADPRADVPLLLEGIVEAFNLRELTFGWPAPSSIVDGPTITLEWECTGDIYNEYEKAGKPNIEKLVNFSDPKGIIVFPRNYDLPIKTSLKIRTIEVSGLTVISRIELKSFAKYLVQ